jgi:hypothetical protein
MNFDLDPDRVYQAIREGTCQALTTAIQGKGASDTGDRIMQAMQAGVYMSLQCLQHDLRTSPGKANGRDQVIR